MVSGPSLHPATVEQIVSVFQAASKQKAWDHFSKAQRKNLDMWRKQAEVGTLWFPSVVHIIIGKLDIFPIHTCVIVEFFIFLLTVSQGQIYD